MTQPGTEPLSLGPVANTLPTILETLKAVLSKHSIVQRRQHLYSAELTLYDILVS